ncbi:MAG TPA: hypothetical protein VHB21_00355 [Minicystis sp.]|nr:hypothetical protein [Minicystis sp.]
MLAHLEEGEGAQYHFDIDEDGVHRAGLDWYHPHIHGATNIVNGLRRPRMLMPPGEIQRWRVVDASPLDEDTIALFYGKDSSCADLDLTRPPVPLTQIGRDGISLPKADADWPFAPPYMFISPGYRVDALLDGSKLHDGDTLCLMSARYLQEETTPKTPATPTPEDILKSITNGDLIAIVNVSKNAGTPMETKMPDLAEVAAEAPPLTLGDGKVDGLSRCAEVAKIQDPEKIDQLAAMWLVFYNTDKLDNCGFPDHNINAKNLMYADRDRYPYDRVLTMGNVDHWRLLSGFDGHPFHIHTNAYLVCPLPPAGSSDPSVAGRLFEPPFAHWRDTYLVNLDRKVVSSTPTCPIRASSGRSCTSCRASSAASRRCACRCRARSRRRRRSGSCSGTSRRSSARRACADVLLAGGPRGPAVRGDS